MNNVFPDFEPEQGEKPGRSLNFGGGREIPVRILIPNIFTLLGLCAGLTAIRMAIELRFEWAIAAVVIAAALDALDGRIARLLKATSRFGAELDSLADFVNFGVAPAIIMFAWSLDSMKSIGWIVVMIFAICAALRLARFNVALDAEQPAWKGNYFVGVPAPAGALILLLPLYLEQVGLPTISALQPFLLVYTLTIALLMVSNLPTFSGKRVGQKIGRAYVLPLFVLAVLSVALLATYPYTTLTLISVGYLALLPFGFFFYRKTEQEMAAEERAEKAQPTLDPVLEKAELKTETS